MKVIKAIYDFLVGDPIILTGIVIALVVLAIINNVGALAAIRSVSGVLMIIAALLVLVLTLRRETSYR